MAQANQADFLGEGTVDPFAGLAPAEDPAAEEARRRLLLQRSATATANINAAPGGYNDTRAAGDQEILDSSNQRAAEHRAANPRHTLFGALIRDPVTMSVLAAPYAVLGAGAALGGLGAGAAVGGGAGGSSYGLPAGIAAESAPFSMPASAALGSAALPAAGAAGVGVPAAAGAATAAGGMPWGDIAKTAIGVAGPSVINEVLGGRTKEQDALIAKQEQLAKEAQVRQGQQQDARMNALGQQLLAFNPTNQMMAQMFGPGAAFTPEQMAGMVQGQAPGQPPAGDPAAQAEYQRRSGEFQQAEEQRRNMMMNGAQPLPQGPAPFQMPAPQAARRF